MKVMHDGGKEFTSTKIRNIPYVYLTFQKYSEMGTFDKSKADLTKIGDTTVCKICLEPGWSWEKCVKPIARSVSSFSYNMISGRTRFKMNYGNKEEYGPGDLAYIPPGHKAWVAGNDPFTGGGIWNYGSVTFI